jgi:hypothetical protein
MNTILLYVLAAIVLPCVPVLIWREYKASRRKQQQYLFAVKPDPNIAKSWRAISKKLDATPSGEVGVLQRKFNEARNHLFLPEIPDLDVKTLEHAPLQVRQFILAFEAGAEPSVVTVMRGSIQDYSVEMHDEWNGDEYIVHRFFFWDTSHQGMLHYEYDCANKTLHLC